MLQTPSPNDADETWRDYLLQRLDAQWTQVAPFDAYFEGDQNLKHLTAKWNEAFGATMGTLISNWCPLVVEAAAERLEVQGFRFGGQSFGGAAQGADDAAWQIWQANMLDSGSDILHEGAVKLGGMYWLVEPPTVNGDPPSITIEHPSQVFVLVDPGDRRKRVAAVKRWWDSDDRVRVNVYRPDRVVKWSSVARQGSQLWVPGSIGASGGFEVESDGVNPLGVVPLIPVLNEPDAIFGGRSVLRNVIPLQDALNKILADSMIGSEYMAYPQRVLLGAEVPKDDKGKPLAGFELVSAQSRLWAFNNPDAKVAEFSAADLQNYTRLREHFLADLMAQQRLPSYYVAGGQLVNISEGSLKVLDAGLVQRVRRAHRSMGESHEEMMRLAFLSVGDVQRAQAMDLHTVWRNPEIRSEAELADAAVKYQAVGVPQEFLWEMLGFAPQQIARMKQMSDLDAARAALTSAAPAVAAVDANAGQ